MNIKNKSKWIKRQLPDEEITVVIRLRNEEWPVTLGFRESGRWYDMSANVINRLEVCGWMHLHEAAALLDRKGAKAA